MYKVGDLIVYSKTGVCKVKNIGAIAFSGAPFDKEYYTLEPLFDEGSIYVPVDTEVPMRPVVSKEEADEIILNIPKAKIGNTNIHKANEIRAAIDKRLETQSPEDLIVVVKTLEKKDEMAEKEGKCLSTTDKNYLKYAKRLLYGEFAVALGIDFDDVREYIDKKNANGKK